MKTFIFSIMLISAGAMAEKVGYFDLLYDGMKSAEGANMDKEMSKTATMLCPELDAAIKDKPNKMDALIEWDLSQCEKAHMKIKMDISQCKSRKTNLARAFVRSALTKACGVE